MVSALDSGSNGPGSIPGGGTALCSWTRHFTLTDYDYYADYVKVFSFSVVFFIL